MSERIDLDLMDKFQLHVIISRTSFNIVQWDTPKGNTAKPHSGMDEQLTQWEITQWEINTLCSTMPEITRAGFHFVQILTITVYIKGSQFLLK